ncbi:MAG TPA: hypothetical protein VM578_03290 [Candidatus Saccharimonadales bacterium]|nr:hypothetical protein [Candidatus Saccharimonadales bacterium]
MKQNRQIVLLLGVLLLIAFLDAVPDPPAINSHSGDVVVSRIGNAACHEFERRLTCDSAFPSSRSFQVRWIKFGSVIVSTLPGDTMAITGHAADPSPPSSTLNFRS